MDLNVYGYLRVILSRASDTLDHDYIMEQVKYFPASKVIKRWLEAGYIFNDKFNETKSGTPQGGIISPFTGKYCVAWNGRSIKY